MRTGLIIKIRGIDYIDSGKILDADEFTGVIAVETNDTKNPIHLFFPTLECGVYRDSAKQKCRLSWEKEELS